jgi:anthranilate synthase component 1
LASVRIRLHLERRVPACFVHPVDLEAFQRDAPDDALVPFLRRIPITPGTPGTPGARALPRALRDGAAFLLESATTGWERDGVALLGFRPRGSIRIDGHRVRVTDHGKVTVTEEANPWQSLARYGGRRPRIAGLPSFSGGLVGYLGWGAVRGFEPTVPARLGADSAFPDAELLIVDDLAAIDWKKGVCSLLVNLERRDFASREAMQTAATERLDALEQELGRTAGPDDATCSVGPLHDAWGPAGFEAAVSKILDHIRAGDCMQVVLSRRLVAPFEGHPLALYERLRAGSPVAYHFFLALGAGEEPARSVIGASPELLLRVENGTVTVRPIAGTRPRGATAAEDRAHEASLVRDPKELAEHVMLIDLGRNDVGRVARPGTVRVEERETVEYFSHVMHLVSQVSGTLADGRDAFDALAAAFPAGTVSGAPKVRAMQIIDALEPVPRGPYGGAVGTVCYDGTLVMAIHLRAMALAGQELRLQAGAGIVADSVPRTELLETEAKLAAVRVAIGESDAGALDTVIDTVIDTARRW